MIYKEKQINISLNLHITNTQRAFIFRSRRMSGMWPFIHEIYSIYICLLYSVTILMSVYIVKTSYLAK
jgi:hypothetical protein